MARDTTAMAGGASNGENSGSGFSLRELRRAPVRTECGTLYVIPEGSRYPDVRGRRKLIGGIGKTTELAASGYCSGGAKWALALTGDLEMAVCQRHARKLGAPLQARRAAQAERLADQVDEPELVTDGGQVVSGPECGVCGHEHPESYLEDGAPRCEACGAYGEPSSRTVRTDGGQDLRLFVVHADHVGANTRSTTWVRAPDKYAAREHVRSELGGHGAHVHPAVEREHAPADVEPETAR